MAFVAKTWLLPNSAKTYADLRASGESAAHKQDDTALTTIDQVQSEKGIGDLSLCPAQEIADSPSRINPRGNANARRCGAGRQLHCKNGLLRRLHRLFPVKWILPDQKVGGNAQALLQTPNDGQG